MGVNNSEILIRTLLRNGIHDMQDSPHRAIRKMVDMAAIFANGAFQQQFFQTAQQMLEDESSGYYTLVQNLVRNTDEERLITYGMNLGFNGCTRGASQIRRMEAEEGFNIPWSISIEISGNDFHEKESRYQELIRQGEELGIYCWMLFPEQEPYEILSLARQHPDSAFAVVCPSGSNIGVLIDEAQDCNNLMVAVPYDSLAGTASGMLRDAGFLYCLYHPYNADSLPDIENGHLLEQIEALNPAFCVLIPEKDCPEAVQAKVHQAVLEGRLSQDYRMILWEFIRDSMLVDSVISEEGCWAAFDKDGSFHECRTTGTSVVLNASDQCLKEILRSAGRRGLGKNTDTIL